MRLPCGRSARSVRGCRAPLRPMLRSSGMASAVSARGIDDDRRHVASSRARSCADRRGRSRRAADCISSIASSIAPISEVIAPRSNGVRKVRRTSVSTPRVMSSASCSRRSISAICSAWSAVALDQPGHRRGRRDQRRGMRLEHAEEVALPGQQALKPVEHEDPLRWRTPLRGCAALGNSEAWGLEAHPRDRRMSRPASGA